MNIAEIAIWFVFGLLLGAILTVMVNVLVKRRLGELLRRVVEDDDEDWPAPPRYPPRNYTPAGEYDDFNDDPPPM